MIDTEERCILRSFCVVILLMSFRAPQRHEKQLVDHFCQKALNTREKPRQGKRPTQDSQKSEKEALGRTRMQKTKDKVYIEANDIQV